MVGLSAARTRGRLGGRKPKLAKDRMNKIRPLWDGNQYSKHELGTMFNVSKSTIDRIVRPEPVGLKVAAKVGLGRGPYLSGREGNPQRRRLNGRRT
jgi:DNA invertase Pin-like site-specific DNA recombinase